MNWQSIVREMTKLSPEVEQRIAGIDARHINWGKNAKARKYLSVCFRNLKQRCNNPKTKHFHRYGGRGIKALINYGQLWDLWERDKGWKLKRPSIDRIDNNGHYIKENCRFIEMVENTRKRDKSIAYLN